MDSQMLLDVADLDVAFNYDVCSGKWKHYDLHTTMGILEYGRELDEIKNFLEITGTFENDTFVDQYEECRVSNMIRIV